MIKQCLDILKQNPGGSPEYSNTHTHTRLRARWRVGDTLTSEAHSHLGVTWQQLKSILTSRKLRRWRTDENVRTASWCCYVAETAEVFSNLTNLHQIAAVCAYARMSVYARAERHGRIVDVARRLKMAFIPITRLHGCHWWIFQRVELWSTAGACLHVSTKTQVKQKRYKIYIYKYLSIMACRIKVFFSSAVKS